MTTNTKPKKTISTHAAAAKAIRQYLKEKGIAGKVTSESYSMGSSVNIHTQDLPPNVYKELKTFAGQFQYGSFDGMIDLYEYTNSRDDIPQVKYVFVNNHASDAMRQNLWDFARSYFAGLENAPASVSDAGRYYIENMGRYGDKLIYQLYAGDWTSAYWDHVNAQQAQQIQKAA